MSTLAGHGFPIAHRTGADAPDLIGPAPTRRTSPAETWREIDRGISTSALPTPYTTSIPPAGVVGIGTVELFLGDDRLGVDRWAAWLSATVTTRRAADGLFERRAVAEGWLGWRRIEVWAPVAESALTDHDRWELALPQLRAVVESLPAEVHAALDHDAVLARDAAYPRKTPVGGAR